MKDDLKRKKAFRIFLPDIIIVILAAVICIFLAGRNSTNDSLVISEKYFMENIGSESLLYYFCDDFDGDGIEEAFGITGDVSGSIEDVKLYDNVRIYFIHADGEIELLMEDTYGCLSADGLINAGSAKFLAWELYWGGSGSISYIFGVVDGEVYEPDISGQYSWFAAADEEGGIFHATTSEFGDEGHEWIDHYFEFDDESGQFEETYDDTEDISI